MCAHTHKCMDSMYVCIYICIHVVIYLLVYLFNITVDYPEFRLCRSLPPEAQQHPLVFRDLQVRTTKVGRPERLRGFLYPPWELFFVYIKPKRIANMIFSLRF